MRTAQPVCVHAHVRHANEAAGGAMENPARDEILHGRGVCLALRVIDVHIEVEHLFPHGDEKAELPLLPGIFLRDLQFDGFIGVAQAGEKR